MSLISYQIPKLALQRFMVKTIWISDCSLSAIFCVIIYCYFWELWNKHPSLINKHYFKYVKNLKSAPGANEIIYSMWNIKTAWATYTPLAKLLARCTKLCRTRYGSGNHAENYSSISATNQRQISSKMYQCNLRSFFFVSTEFRFVQNLAN